MDRDREAARDPRSFEALAETFDTARGLPVDGLHALADLIDEIADGQLLRIIEPGVGTGRIAVTPLAHGHHVTGVDISAGMLRRFQSKLARRPETAPSCALVRADAAALPFRSPSFDLGLLAYVLYLVPDWQRALDELARVVKPDGAVIAIIERTESGPELSRWDATWRETIEATGYRHPPIVPDDDVVIAALRKRYRRVEVRSLATWEIGQTVEQALVGYGERLRPLYPSVDAATWSDAVARFIAWAVRAFPDWQARLDGVVHLEAGVARGLPA